MINWIPKIKRVQFGCLDYILRIETVSCYLLQWMQKMDINWNSERLLQLFLSFDAMPAKITETLLKNYHAKLFPIISSWWLLHNSTGSILCMGWVIIKWWLQHRIDLKQQYSHDMTPLSGIIPAPVVQKVDNAIRWINLYSVDSVIGFPNTYLPCG